MCSYGLIVINHHHHHAAGWTERRSTLTRWRRRLRPPSTPPPNSPVCAAHSDQRQRLDFNVYQLVRSFVPSRSSSNEDAIEFAAAVRDSVKLLSTSPLVAAAAPDDIKAFAVGSNPLHSQLCFFLCFIFGLFVFVSIPIRDSAISAISFRRRCRSISCAAHPKPALERRLKVSPTIEDQVREIVVDITSSAFVVDFDRTVAGKPPWNDVFVTTFTHSLVFRPNSKN